MSLSRRSLEKSQQNSPAIPSKKPERSFQQLPDQGKDDLFKFDLTLERSPIQVSSSNISHDDEENIKVKKKKEKKAKKEKKEKKEKREKPEKDKKLNKRDQELIEHHDERKPSSEDFVDIDFEHDTGNNPFITEVSSKNPFEDVEEDTLKEDEDTEELNLSSSNLDTNQQNKAKSKSLGVKHVVTFWHISLSSFSRLF